MENVDSLTKSIEIVYNMPLPSTADTSGVAQPSQKLPSKAVGVDAIEGLITLVEEANLFPEPKNCLKTSLEAFSKICVERSRDFRAALRTDIIEKVIAPITKNFIKREDENNARIYDLESMPVGLDERQYLAKIKESQSCIEYLRGRLLDATTDLEMVKKEFKESSKFMRDTIREIKVALSHPPTPSFASVTQRPAAVRPTSLAANIPIQSQPESHVLLLKPKTDAPAGDARRVLETALVSRNSATRVSRITSVGGGGLLIEAPSEEDLQALEREVACVTEIGDNYSCSKPQKRRPQIIIFGLDNSVDRAGLQDSLGIKNHYLLDERNRPRYSVDFPVKGKRSTHWVVSLDPAIYKMIWREGGLYHGLSRHRFDNFFSVRQCRHCRRYGHIARFCPQADASLCDGCGLDHETNACPGPFCVNCEHANQQFRANYEVNHRPTDRIKCKSFARQKLNVIKITNYGH